MPLIKLELQSLESRENPSVPLIDPFGGRSPVPYTPGQQPPVSPPPPILPPSPGFFERLVIKVQGEMLRQAVYPYLEDNSVYKTPLVLPMLPK